MRESAAITMSGAEVKPATPHLRATFIRSDAELAAFGPAWNALAEASLSATIFQSHEWTSLWWKHFARRHDRLCIVTVYDDATLIGLAPLFERAGIPFFSPRLLTMIGGGGAFRISRGLFLDDGPSDFLDLLALPGREEDVAGAVIDALTGQPHRADEIHLLNAPEGGIVKEQLLPMMERRGFSCAVKTADLCPYLPLPSSRDEYLRSLSQGTRRKFSQSARATGEGGSMQLQRSVSPAECATTLEYLIDLHQRRWNRMGFPGLFSRPHYREFFGELVEALARSGKLWCTTATDGRQPVAARIVFRFNGTLYDYLSGFDDASPLAKHRPGFALVIAMINDAFTAGLSEINFLRGDEPYKFELTDMRRTNANAVVLDPAYARSLRRRITRFSGMLRLALYLAGREIDLFRVQLGQQPFLGAPLRYLRFRSSRLAGKVRSMAGQDSAGDGKKER